MPLPIVPAPTTPIFWMLIEVLRKMSERRAPILAQSAMAGS
jgi:hypothetical protein